MCASLYALVDLISGIRVIKQSCLIIVNYMIFTPVRSDFMCCDVSVNTGYK